MDHVTRRRHLARHLARFATVVAQHDAALDGTTPEAPLGLDNRVADEFVTTQLRRLLASSPLLTRRARRVRVPIGAAERRREVLAVEYSLDRALRADPAVVDALWPLLAPALAAEPAGPVAPVTTSKHRRAVAWMFGRHAAAVLLLTATIAGVVIVGVWSRAFQLASLSAMELVVIWILSFLPGYLYIRFIGQRAGAIWDEFVLNVHRLRLDEPRHLPQPPVNSVYFHDWFDGGGATLSRHRNIYRQKFDAYYGRCVSAASEDSRLKAGTFFPVVLATVLFAVGWTALLWDGTFLDGMPTSAVDMLAFGFLGAYLFDVQMLIRRFFQSDLKPSAYVSAAVRVVVVLIVVLAMHQLIGDGSRRYEAVVAFVIGLFPLVGLQALNGFVAKFLRRSVPSLQSAYPLSDLDGLNVWYEARLMEEGIEDMQNLISANMVDVLLHTRVPVGRLVDWFDQAHLFLHLRPRPSGSEDERAKHARTALATFGVRNATTFLKAFASGRVDAEGQAADPLVRRALAELKQVSPELTPPAVMTIARVLDQSPALRPIQSWHEQEGASRQRDAEAVRAPVASTTIRHLEPKRADGGGSDDDEAA